MEEEIVIIIFTDKKTGELMYDELTKTSYNRLQKDYQNRHEKDEITIVDAFVGKRLVGNVYNESLKTGGQL